MKKAKKIDLDGLADKISKAQSILIATHENPDGDGLGSILALGKGLKKLGKKVTIYSKDHVPKMYQFLPGQNAIVSQLKKSARYDLSFIVDLGEIERVGEEFLNFPHRGVTISLDHHARGVHNADFNYCLPKCASSGEVIFKVIKRLNISLDKAMATAIYTAIVTDTGSFKYSNTTEETFAVASELVSHKVDVWQVALHCFETSSQARMELLKRVIGKMQIHSSKKIAWIVLKQSDYKATGALPEEAEGFINYPRSIEGVEVAIAFKEKERGVYRISLRSKTYVDVATVAQGFDGGGHIRAAGCTIEGKFEDVQKKLIAAIQKQI
ncbi:MAG: bifunctional oligoribonuclease/PAP phosphatase NrnA [Deltaproteobacteria bacterium]|nr:bifunctional oligoribonuclease/PAP phosphatase NrnA [Deltaproteobacteria bacterium]